MKHMKQLVFLQQFLVTALSWSALQAAETTVKLSESGFVPGTLVLQAGEAVSFSRVERNGSLLTVVIEGGIGGPGEGRAGANESWEYVFATAGRYRFFVKERPAIQGNAVVFPGTGVNSDLRGEKVSYSIGYDFGRKMLSDLQNVDLELFVAGVEHAYSDQEPKLSRGEIDFIVNELSREVSKNARQRHERVAHQNKEKGRRFLDGNAQAEGVVALPSGLQYKVVKRGWGVKPETGSTVTVHYKATFLDGMEFDGTVQSGPAQFVLTDSVMPGFSEGLRLMSEGARWKLFLPPQLAYGPRGRPVAEPGSVAVEPNATIILEVELLAVAEAESR